MRRVIEGIARFWRERIVGPKLRTYAESCEELGGQPWRPFAATGATERWFMPAAATTTGESRPITLDTAALTLAGGAKEWLKKLPRTAWMVGGATLLTAILIVIGFSSSSSHASTKMVAPAAVAAAPIAQAAPVIAPASAPAPGTTAHATLAKPAEIKPAGQSGGMHSSVKALFGSNGPQKSARGKARPTRLKKIHRR